MGFHETFCFLKQLLKNQTIKTILNSLKNIS